MAKPLLLLFPLSMTAALKTLSKAPSYVVAHFHGKAIYWWFTLDATTEVSKIGWDKEKNCLISQDTMDLSATLQALDLEWCLNLYWQHYAGSDCSSHHGQCYHAAIQHHGYYPPSNTDSQPIHGTNGCVFHNPHSGCSRWSSCWLICWLSFWSWNKAVLCSPFIFQNLEVILPSHLPWSISLHLPCLPCTLSISQNASNTRA